MAKKINYEFPKDEVEDFHAYSIAAHQRRTQAEAMKLWTLLETVMHEQPRVGVAGNSSDENPNPVSEHEKNYLGR